MRTAGPPLRRRVSTFLASILLAGCASSTAGTPHQVVLTLGDSYEQVRRQSRSTLPKAHAFNYIDLSITRPATFRFSDPQYGFATPAGNYLSIYAPDGRVSSLKLLPHLKALPLDETIALVLDLQNQLRRKGWVQMQTTGNPPVVDTPAVRDRIRRNQFSPTFWMAGDRYEVWIHVVRYLNGRRPADNHYMVMLDLGPPLKNERLRAGAMSPLVPHPGTVAVRQAWNGAVAQHKVSDPNAGIHFQCYDRTGRYEAREDAYWCVPIVEHEVVSVDKFGTPVAPEVADTVSYLLYGPGHVLLRHLPSRPGPGHVPEESHRQRPAACSAVEPLTP